MLTCRASLLTASLSLAASLAVPHVKCTSPSFDVGAVDFVIPAMPKLPAPVTSRWFLLFFFPIALQFLLFNRISAM